MTDTLNFIHFSFLIRSLAPRRPAKGVLKLAVLLKRDAEAHAEAASREFENASAAAGLLANASDGGSRGDLLEIAKWHFANAATSYERAAARFEEAGRLETAKRREFNRNAKHFSARAAASTAAAQALTTTTNQ